MVMLQKVTLMEGEWSCYGGGQFKGGGARVTEVASNKGRITWSV